MVSFNEKLSPLIVYLSLIHIFGHAVGQAAQGRRRGDIAGNQGADAHIFRVLDAQLGRHSLHQAPGCDDVHGIHDALADVVVAQIAGGVPVADGFLVHRVLGVVVDGSQGSPAAVQCLSLIHI